MVILFLILILVFYIYNGFHFTENLEDTIVTNAFSGLLCIDDTLPLIRVIDNKTIQCISKNGNDTQNCMTRSDFNIPANIKCSDINTFLVKEIRDQKSPVTKVYNNLESNTNYNLLSCNPDGFNNKNSWCGKAFDNITKIQCVSPSGKYGVFSEPCKILPKYAKEKLLGSDTTVINKSQILDAKAAAKLLSDLSRNPALCTGIQSCRDTLTTGGGGRSPITCTFKNVGDGNLKIYNKNNTQVWQSNTVGKGVGPYTIVLTNTGNLTLVDSKNTIVWQSNSKGTSISPLYQANLLETSGSCSLQITDRNSVLVWKSNF